MRASSCSVLLLCLLLLLGVGGFHFPAPAHFGPSRPSPSFTSSPSHTHTHTRTHAHKRTLHMVAPFDCAAFPKLAAALYGAPPVATAASSAAGAAPEVSTYTTMCARAFTSSEGVWGGLGVSGTGFLTSFLFVAVLVAVNFLSARTRGVNRGEEDEYQERFGGGNYEEEEGGRWGRGQVRGREQDQGGRQGMGQGQGRGQERGRDRTAVAVEVEGGETCPQCRGTGRFSGTCDLCGGLGVVDMMDDDQFTLPSNTGKGDEWESDEV